MSNMSDTLPKPTASHLFLQIHIKHAPLQKVGILGYKRRKLPGIAALCVRDFATTWDVPSTPTHVALSAQSLDKYHGLRAPEASESRRSLYLFAHVRSERLQNPTNVQLLSLGG